MLCKASLALLALVLVLGPVEARSRYDHLSNSHGCALIDRSHPPQFITYEGKSQSEIQLRLRNNTSCSIVVETDDRYPIQINKALRTCD